MSDDAPSFDSDIVYPKVIEGFVPVPLTKEVAVFGVDTHRVAIALRGCVVIGVVPVALENENGVEELHEGVLQLDLGTGGDGLVGVVRRGA